MSDNQTYCFYCQREYGTFKKLCAHLRIKHNGSIADWDLNHGAIREDAREAVGSAPQGTAGQVTASPNDLLQSNADEADRERYENAIRLVRQNHRPNPFPVRPGGPTYRCSGCSRNYPCPTIRILDMARV